MRYTNRLVLLLLKGRGKRHNTNIAPQAATAAAVALYVTDKGGWAAYRL